MFLSPGSRARKRLAATKAEQQAGRTMSAPVTPLHQQDHPSAAKAWAVCSPGAIPGITVSYNVASVVQNGGIGRYRVTWIIPFSTFSYAVIVNTFATSGGLVSNVIGRTTTTCDIETFNSAGAFNDPTTDFSIVAWGTQ